MTALKNRVIRIEDRIASARTGDSLDSQFEALEAGRLGYSGVAALVIACMTHGLEKGIEDLPEPLKSFARRTLAKKNKDLNH